jgi:predicted nucleic acid-binding protein
MRTVFADSFYFFALLNPRDPDHAKAVAFTGAYTGRIVTTGWVLTELADGWAKPISWRSIFIQLLADLRANPNVTVVPCTDHLLDEGINFYAQRPDQEWSLTDCISFVVMRREGIAEDGPQTDERRGMKRKMRSWIRTRKRIRSRSRSRTSRRIESYSSSCS